ncbi:hypothetical protein J3Q64DRAFT_1729793 [Phycomyces blakesleeanus]|uniref:Uncharacterized protein n=1 Tax=Phycomyces blakesleeanus TaxID=4837 RepID=A0ABR3B7C7_PHYBL
MPLGSDLNVLLSNSAKVGAVKLACGSTSTNSDTGDHSRIQKRLLVRNAESNERKLFAASFGDSAPPLRIRATLLQNQQDNLENEEITQMLSTAYNMCDICNIPEMRSIVDELKSRHEDTQLSIEYLEKKSQQNEKEIASLSALPPLPTDDLKEQDDPKEPIRLKLEVNVRDLKEDISQLEKSAKEKRKMIYDLIAKIDYAKANQEPLKINISKQPGEDSILEQIKLQENTINKLQKDIEKEQNLLKDYDSKFEAIAASKENPNLKGKQPAQHNLQKSQVELGAESRELFTILCAKADKIINGANELNQPVVDKAQQQEFIEAMNEIKYSLEQVIGDIQKARNISISISHLKKIDQNINTFALDGYKHAEPDTAQDVYVPSPTIRLIAKILCILEEPKVREAGIPMSVLKKELYKFAGTIGQDEGTAAQAIYRLTAMGLASIDRSSPDLIIQLT